MLYIGIYMNGRQKLNTLVMRLSVSYNCIPFFDSLSFMVYVIQKKTCFVRKSIRGMMTFVRTLTCHLST